MSDNTGSYDTQNAYLTQILCCDSGVAVEVSEIHKEGVI